MATLHIANSVRLILAMFRLYADIETGFGKAILQILKENYPDQDIDADPAQVGHKMMNIARKQLRGNDTESMDAIQDLLTYLSTGSTYETDERGVVQYDEDGNAIKRKEAKPWNFAKDFDTWKAALNAIYSNLKQTAMSRSMGGVRRDKKTKGIEESFGRRTDEGGFEDAEGRIPTGDESALGKALDDKAALKEFYTLIDESMEDLKASLSEDARKLFELIFEDEVGDFGSDIKANMGQATALKEKHPELYEENAKRWSGFVGDLRKKLLKEIWEFVENDMTPKEFRQLRDQFFSDTDPSAVRRMEKKKEEEKVEYQRMLDENKISRLKAKMEESDGKLSDKDQKTFDRLQKRLEEQGVDVDAIEADAKAGAKSKKKKKKKDDEARAAATVLASAMHLMNNDRINQFNWY